jgi:hypothetical protein
MRVPDLVEPVAGWRCWRVVDGVDGLELASTHHDLRWPPGWPATAACELGHDAPAVDCTCGIHAAREPALAFAYLPPHIKQTLRARQPEVLGYDVVMAVGRVGLWGSVIEADRGWRGAFGYPRELYVPARATHFRRRHGQVTTIGGEALAAALGELYGVPVEITTSLEAAVLASG